jgi:SAM-dependent methyltransferase
MWSPSANTIRFRPIHPFPARMAPSIVRKRFCSFRTSMRILDPMVGSGTTIVSARLHGHHAIGFDTDPLALLISRTWSSTVNPEDVRFRAQEVLNRARRSYRNLTAGKAYPHGADSETRKFIRFWFDPTARRQLTALSNALRRIKCTTERDFLWSAFSRLIITKQAGASLAMDVSHSRPHKVYKIAPVKAFDRFLHAVDAVLNAAPFSRVHNLPRAIIREGDARNLPIDDASIDLVITSPPYLNAIDYLRGHKFSLVWMGHVVDEVRRLRAHNIGSESSEKFVRDSELIHLAESKMGSTTKLPVRSRGMLAQYLRDMNKVLAEINRVLKHGGEAVLVIGDSTIRGVFLRNSRALTYLGRENGLTLKSVRRRPLLENRRYLPPPGKRNSGRLLRSRMKEEVILTFLKAHKIA